MCVCVCVNQKESRRRSEGHAFIHEHGSGRDPSEPPAPPPIRTLLGRQSLASPSGLSCSESGQNRLDPPLTSHRSVRWRWRALEATPPSEGAGSAAVGGAPGRRCLPGGRTCAAGWEAHLQEHRQVSAGVAARGGLGRGWYPLGRGWCRSSPSSWASWAGGNRTCRQRRRNGSRSSANAQQKRENCSFSRGLRADSSAR